jgi:hypothetical protein
VAPLNAAKPAPELSGNRLQNIDSLAASDISKHNQTTGNAQAKIDPSRVTCASMRADQLRLVTEIDLDRLQVKLLTAKAFNREELDDDADEILRECWRLFQATVTPVRTELQRLRGAR